MVFDRCRLISLLILVSFLVDCQSARIFFPAKDRTEDENHATIDAGRRLGDSESVSKRYRREPEATNDYMSSYYAQRQAILDKYKSQQREIMEKLDEARSKLAATRKTKDPKENRTQHATGDFTESPILGNRLNDRKIESVTDFPRNNFNAESSSRSVTFSGPSEHVPRNDTQRSPSGIDNGSRIMDWTVVTEEKTLDVDYNLEARLNSSSSISNVIDSGRPGVTLNDWSNERFDLLARDEVEPEVGDDALRRYQRHNDSLVEAIEASKTDELSSKIRLANDVLDGMLQWDMPSDDNGAPRDVSFENEKSGSSHALSSKVDVNASPGVHLTKNVQNVKSTTIVWRNSTHELIQMDDGVNTTLREYSATDDHVPKIYSKNMENVTSDATEMYGGAQESEWCEECPHDYHWGTCSGVHFYQHNIFLRNHGLSSIDAIFGMDAQGPIKITCVEALRFNDTRGIVSLYSGGPGFNFVQLRIRGFYSEGFSYVLKVWGVGSEDLDDRYYPETSKMS